jgi:hypothetical protein
VVSTVPTLLNRQGHFADLLNSAGRPIIIYDRATGQPFAGNIIPLNRIDPVALAALQYWSRCLVARHARLQVRRRVPGGGQR